MKRKNEMNISEALLFWIKQNKIEQKIHLEELKSKWKFMLGEEIYKQTKKIELKDNKADFYLNSPLLKADFLYQKEKIKKSLNKLLEHFKLDEIDFKIE